MRAEQHQDQRTLQFAASAVEEDGGGEIEWGRRREKNGRRERAEREGHTSACVQWLYDLLLLPW